MAQCLAATLKMTSGVFMENTNQATKKYKPKPKSAQKVALYENFVHAIFLALAMVAVASVVLITVYLIASGLGAFRAIGVKKFLLGTKWKPVASPQEFGILPFILTSAWGSCAAVALGAPIGILVAVYLAKIASPAVKKTVGLFVSVLAGVPSVVYGLVGMVVLVPAVGRLFSLPDGSSLFTSILVLALMSLPSIIKVSVTALEAVPKTYEEASRALGATATETYFKVSLLAAKSGIMAAIALGVGRATGEAMAVMMVSGNAPNMPKLFESVRFLTTAVASEMSYSEGLHRQALFSISLVLFVFIMAINGLIKLLAQSQGLATFRKVFEKIKSKAKDKNGKSKL